jgi:hypothetical protein
MNRKVRTALRRITAHLGTPEGRRDLESAKRDAEALIADLRRKRRISWSSLWQRVTI